MAGMSLVALPSPGIIGGVPRKESVYDTEAYVAGAAIPTERNLFQNFTSFAVTPGLGAAKQSPRDTNLQGGNAGLPQAHFLYMYGWRAKHRTLNANMGTAANVVVTEELNRFRELGGVGFSFSQTQIIAAQLDELPSGTGPANVFTTHGAATVMSPQSGTPDRANFYDVTVGGRPIQVEALQDFRVRQTHPNTAGLVPTVDIYSTHILVGILLRGSAG